jgi:hypothetical protein
MTLTILQGDETMKTHEFHLGDILSVTTGRLLAVRNGKTDIGGLYDILGFMTSETLFTHQLPRASDQCRPWLLAHHPQLDSPEMRHAIAELGVLANTKAGKADPDKLVMGWLGRMTEKYGETLVVQALPGKDEPSPDPIDELAEMIGRDNVRMVVAPNDTGGT